ncbi:GerAB/ArcD/ProY family transporter [Paenibacillus sp. PAMC21692]|uniref:GerAB/ArcD/ProY family transporter n=1 Tax=Paenibacillus sp. PAMC21692 TaxID=2762320 RepID=UPI00164D35B4|nr:GerAB/ArcD/ProY family transporter [Paenibacillus sp. PAMC21692]QNK56768.1 GerAB/ArcD/ProY family transporter [Paenibacillus sp. PAMC21692]
MSSTAKKSLTVSPYLLWFVLHASQTGIGVLNFQIGLSKGAGMDSWLSLIVTGLAFHVAVALMFYVLRYAKDGDLISLHGMFFGRYAGTALTFLFYGYCLMAAAAQLRSYAEIISVWAFPNSRLLDTAALVLFVCVYIVSGGFRVIAGVAFFSVILPTLLIPTLYYPLQWAHWDNFLPMFDHGFRQYMESTKQSVFVFLGIEFLLIYYPYIKDNGKSRRWAHIGVAHTTVLYLIILIVTFSYFNLNQLENVIWPTLYLSKIIKITVLERFDYVYVFTWFLVIMSAACIALWCGARLLKRSTSLNSRYGLWLSAGLVFAIVCLFRSPAGSHTLNWLVSYSGMGILFGYLPLLSIVVFVKRQLERKQYKRV